MAWRWRDAGIHQDRVALSPKIDVFEMVNFEILRCGMRDAQMCFEFGRELQDVWSRVVKKTSCGNDVRSPPAEATAAVTLRLSGYRSGLPQHGQPRHANNSHIDFVKQYHHGLAYKLQPGALRSSSSASKLHPSSSLKKAIQIGQTLRKVPTTAVQKQR